jgi:hypothetical protein
MSEYERTSTPPPVYTSGSGPSDHPQSMDHKERADFRAAAFRAPSVYPGPVGELIARELMIIDEFGYRLGAEAFGNRLAKAVMDAPLPSNIGQQSSTRPAPDMPNLDKAS